MCAVALGTRQRHNINSRTAGAMPRENALRSISGLYLLILASFFFFSINDMNYAVVLFKIHTDIIDVKKNKSEQSLYGGDSSMKSVFFFFY